MCGIVGYFGNGCVEDVLIEKLKLLEYRGYDSAGIAVKKDSKINVTKSVGEIANLEKAVKKTDGAILGIGHTRWATHGKPTELNAHPHLSANKEWAIVHNGIIENYAQLKASLEKDGYKFYSDTDTEIVAKLIEYYRTDKFNTKNHEAVLRACKNLEGSFALAIINKNQNKIYFAKNKSPLYCSLKDGEFMLASDPICFVGFADEYFTLKDDEFGFYSDGELVFVDKLDLPIKKEATKLDCSNYNLNNSYKHYMIKEIYEGKDAIRNVIEHYSNERVFSKLDKIDLSKIKNIKIVGCGTAYHAGLVGANMVEKMLGVECNAYIASEFRYSDPKVDENSLVFFISQSGETADTLAAEEISRKKGATTVAVVNVEYSTLAKNATMYFPIKAGVEISVASTKAYVAQIAVLFTIISKLVANKNGEKLSLEPLYELEKAMVVENENRLKLLADVFQYQNNLFMIGRGDDYCTAQEACLKIKETSYINANTYFAGELKHGFLALIEDNTYVVVFATEESVLQKTLANAAEAKARGAKLILHTSLDITKEQEQEFYFVIKVKKLSTQLQNVVNILPWQIIAYYTAIYRGFNPDKPRNLAKSVTVE